MIAETAAQIRAAGLPDMFNRWLTMTPADLDVIEARQLRARQLTGTNPMPTIGKRELALRAQRAEDAKTKPAPASPPAPTAGAPAPPPTASGPTQAREAHARKLHAADAEALAAISQAKSFTVDIFHAQQHHKRENIGTLAEARAEGAKMKADLISTRDFIVYAVLEDGRSFPVPRDYQPAPATQTEDQMKTTSAKKTTSKPKAKGKPAPKRAAKPKSDKAAAQANARKPAGQGEGKTDIAVRLLSRAGGATRKEITDATDWPSINLNTIAKRRGMKIVKEGDKMKLEADPKAKK